MAPSPAPASVDPARDTAPSIARPAVVYFLLFVSMGAWLPYFSVFFEESGLSLELVGLLAAVYAGVALVAAPLWGALGDRRRDLRLPLVLAGAWAASAALLLAVVRGPVAISLAVVLIAIGMAGLAPMLDSLTIQTLGERRERFGRARAAGSAAFILGSLATGAAIDAGGAVALFTLLVPALLATTLAAWLLLRGGQRPRVAVISPLQGLAGILRHRTLGLFLLGSTLVWTSVTAVTTFISVHLFALDAPGPLVGSVWALGALVEVPLMLAFPMLVRRWGDERLLVIAVAAFALRSAAWSVAGDPLLIVALAPLGGVGFGLFYVGTVGYIARTVPPDVQATAQGLFSGTSFSTGSILGALLGGQLAGTLGIPAMFAVASVTTALAGLLVWWAIEGGHARQPTLADDARREIRA